MYHPHDRFARRAQQLGYRARSVFKLQEIDKKYRLLHRGDIVLDLGAAPGSWLQYAARTVGPDGHVYGVDQQPIKNLTEKNVTVWSADILLFDFSDNRLPRSFDVILSDLAPATQGTKFADSARSLQLVNRTFAIARHKLKINGNFCAKIFMGEDVDAFYAEWRKYFRLSKRYKPTATRSTSKELYLIGIGYQPPRKVQSTNRT